MGQPGTGLVLHLCSSGWPCSVHSQLWDALVHWVMNWLCGKALRAISNGAASACGWSLVLSPGPSFRVSLVQTVLSVTWVLEWSASSAGLLMALNWEVLWTPWRDKKPRRGCG